MLATMCSLMLLAQGPSVGLASTGGLRGVEVRGSTELSRGEAMEAARRQAVDRIRDRFAERGARIAGSIRPLWMPGFAVRQVVDDWLARLDASEAMEVLDHEEKRRFHDFGDSYQTTLWIGVDRRYEERADARLRRAMRNAEKTFLYKTAGTAGFWAVLALVLGWFDRLSRGYMTGRLWAVGIGLGAVVPVVGFLL